MDIAIKKALPIGDRTVIELSDVIDISIGQFVYVDNLKVKVISIPMLPVGKIAIEVDVRIKEARTLTV
ncbi:hypothetical protein [Weissella cibaria]|uniref:hypothetical protein n=1 Tax=Weissella cibaria TaxID=137591 RepID=UPI00223B8877|nr:hypothetical protein [Weissella cibaria]MCS8561300.1 hypothetical protein [Weissella cibaria]MCS8566023.1 hypothetical protein [Weissella cibaria]MCS8576959.1 hypothetical protein [Weissella cibaria]